MLDPFHSKTRVAVPEAVRDDLCRFERDQELRLGGGGQGRGLIGIKSHCELGSGPIKGIEGQIG